MSLYPYEMVNVSAALEALRELKRQLSAASDPLSPEECAELRAAIAEVDCALENHEVSPRVGPPLAEAKTTLASRPPLRWPVPVLLRVQPSWQVPAGCNVTSRLGDVVSCSLTEEAYKACEKDRNVRSIEESRGSCCR